MRCMSGGLEKVAPGWDNPDGLQNFAAIEPPWFKGYRRGGFTAEWQGQDELVLASDRLTFFKVGLPTLKLTFPIVTGEEIQILRSQEGKVTIHALDQDTMEWGNYNATMRLPDIPSVSDKFEKRDYIVTFYDLVLLS